MIAPLTDWKLPAPAPMARPARGWLEDLHVAHGPGIRAMLRQMLSNEDEASDVYQDCLFRLARSSQTVSFGSVQAYAYRTAANLAVETLRRRQRHAAHRPRVVAHRQAVEDARRCPSTDGSPCDNRPTSGRLRSAVGKLPRHLHDVVVLRDLAELPYRTVARILGIQPTTARVYRRQAVVRLGRLLGEACPQA